jgi:hypothetical protein
VGPAVLVVGARPLQVGCSRAGAAAARFARGSTAACRNLEQMQGVPQVLMHTLMHLSVWYAEGRY